MFVMYTAFILSVFSFCSIFRDKMMAESLGFATMHFRAIYHDLAFLFRHVIIKFSVIDHSTADLTGNIILRLRGNMQ